MAKLRVKKEDGSWIEISGLKHLTVSTLPVVGEEDVLYFLHTADMDEGVYTLHIYDDDEWMKVGNDGSGSWSNIKNKPFNTIGENLIVENGELKVDTATTVEEDNTRPVTSGAVYTVVGNIDALLSLI